MKLTFVLCRWKKALPGGHIWRGKHRLYKKVTPLAIAEKKAEYKLEEENMFYLRHPYLTPEQSKGHAKLFDHHNKFIEKHRNRAVSTWKDNELIGDSFGFLKVSDKWE